MMKDEKAYKILVIEDNDGDYCLIEELLGEQFASPAIVRGKNYHQASELLSLHSQTFDVVLLDLSLPDKSKGDLVRQMLRIVSGCPIIILTGYTDIDFSIIAITQGISDYLIKDDLSPTLLYKSIVYSIERKKSILLVASSEKRYSDLFHLSPQPMWLFDPETLRFVQVNKATIELYGYSEEEFMRMDLMDIKMDKDVLKAREDTCSRKSGDGVFRRTIQHQKKSGQLIEVEIFSSPILIGDKRLISVIAIDVTEKNLWQQNTIKAIINAQEDERYGIGGELHDNVCQILAASQIYLGILKKSLMPAGTESYEGCNKNLELAMQEIRNLSHRLAPAFFSDSTIEEDYRRLFDTFNAEKKLEMSLHLDQAVRNYPMTAEIQLNLYRILQEQLKNIQKYANATVVEVDLLMQCQGLKMRIYDNGIGFNTGKVKNGIGFANMKRRAELFSGKVEIHSAPGAGCELIVDIPLPELRPSCLLP